MQDFTKLNVWQRSHALVLAVYRDTRAFPREEQFGLTGQIRRAGASVPANIAEGCGSNSSADFAWFLQMAMRSAFELQYHLILACDLGYLDSTRQKHLTAEVIGVKRMLASLITGVRPKSANKHRARATKQITDSRQPITDNR